MIAKINAVYYYDYDYHCDYDGDDDDNDYFNSIALCPYLITRQRLKLLTGQQLKGFNKTYCECIIEYNAIL